MLHAVLVAAIVGVQPSELPVVDIAHDNTRITQSCRVHIAPGTVIQDADDNGVIQVAGANITIVFEPDSVLRGAPAHTRPDQMTGIGIAASNAPNLSIQNASISGFKRGVFISSSAKPTLERCTFTDNYRQHLGSTPEAEDSADWLWPHDNTSSKWALTYGAAVHLLKTTGATISGCTIRSTQNGIILDHAINARVFDNDASFLSGWGLALWHVSDSSIQRNAFDFCIRGYSHGVYNRGQDSAGILYFEQCQRNVFALNSATHSGDGFFAFSGKSALGESDELKPVSYARAGNTDTILFANDFSYAAAHGVETTFSFGFTLNENRLIANAICGVWGGYSQDMLITNNTISQNGQAGYGLERGGVNIEHGFENLIVNNRFNANSCGVHLWSDEDPGIAKTPWYAANHKGSSDNFIANNSFDGDTTAVHLRKSVRTALASNTYTKVGKELESDEPTQTASALPEIKPSRLATPPSIGNSFPVGKRSRLAGRENIIMGEWGPWDHQSPMARLASRKGNVDTYEVFAAPADFKVDLDDTSRAQVDIAHEDAKDRVVLRVTPKHDVSSYTLNVSGHDLDASFANTIVRAQWAVRVFPWTIDPRQDAAGWRKQAESPDARDATINALNLRFANNGPKSLRNIPEFKDAPIGNDHFGTIATTTLTLPPGNWTISTLSDDGVRVFVNDAAVIDNWTWHAPTRDTANFHTDGTAPTMIRVEHFELDGYSTLELTLTPK